jgi:hypothetical protein
MGTSDTQDRRDGRVRRQVGPVRWAQRRAAGMSCFCTKYGYVNVPGDGFVDSVFLRDGPACQWISSTTASPWFLSHI